MRAPARPGQNSITTDQLAGERVSGADAPINSFPVGHGVHRLRVESSSMLPRNRLRFRGRRTLHFLTKEIDRLCPEISEEYPRDVLGDIRSRNISPESMLIAG